MLILSSTTDALQVITSSVADIDYVVTYVNKDNSATPVITPDDTAGTIVTAATTNIGPTPIVNNQIAIQSIELRNRHATVSNDLTVQIVKAGGTARQLFKATLAAGEKLARDKNGVWFVYDITGGVKSTAVPDTGRAYNQLATQLTPPIVPPVGSTAMWFQKYANRPFLVIDGEGIGDPTRQQPALFSNGITLLKPGTGAVSPPVIGGGTTDGGTLTHPALASTNFRTMARHSLYSNVVTTTNQFLGRRLNEAAVWRGNAAGLGGFFFHARFSFPLFPTGTRVFIGLSSLLTGVQVTADPSAAAHDGIGLAMDIADTTLSIMTKDGTTNTKTAIGGGLARTANDVYDLYFYCKPNDTQIYARLDQYVAATGATTKLFDASISTTLPRNTIFLAPMAAMSNGTANITVTTVQLALMSLYLESDF